VRTGEVSSRVPAQHGAGGWRALARGVALALGLALVPLTACTSYEKGQAGDRCTSDAPCAKGLRCSFKKKRCYRPVDCNRLAKRLNACTVDLFATWRPAFQKLPATKRTALVQRLRAHLKSEVVDHCRFDARAYRRKHGTTPPTKKSWGEDRDAAVINGCLKKATCGEFATCWLTQARMIGKNAPNKNRMKVFPLALPQARPATPADTGAPKDAMKPKDATKAKDAMKPKDATKAKDASSKTAQRPRPRPAPRPRPR